MSETYKKDELEKYLRLAPGDTRITGVLASEVLALRTENERLRGERDAARAEVKRLMTLIREVCI